MQMLRDLRAACNFVVLVAGLGYFVDLFDITLFSVVRTTSLTDLGVTDVLGSGVLIYNAQMIGLMIGGVIWGRLGDRRGRLSVLMGSILLYSLANFANAFVWNTASYAAVRFLGGVGLAGELGAAITLVAESLPRERRGLGTTIVAMLGMLGIVAAAEVGQLVSWRIAYVIGAMMGLSLLAARFKVHESILFEKPSTATNSVSRGSLALLLKRGRLKKYLACIFVGAPLYFTTGVLFTFAPELTAGLHIRGTVTAGNAILYGSFGLALGDLFAGLLSQYLKSRKKAVATMLTVGLILMWVDMHLDGLTPKLFYLMSFLIGTCVGYWAVLITISAEQFGTNIRATVATTVPNFVRGTAIFSLFAFQYLRSAEFKGSVIGSANAALIVGTICFAGALICLFAIDETFSRDLDYNESLTPGSD